MKKATIKKSPKKRQLKVTKVTKKAVKSAKVLSRQSATDGTDDGKKKTTIKKPALTIASAKAAVFHSETLREGMKGDKEIKKKISKTRNIFPKKNTSEKVAQKKVQSKSSTFTVEKVQSKPDRYFEATGKRKTSVARVRLFTRGEKILLVNDKSYKEYFPLSEMQQITIASLKKMNCIEKFKILVKVRGGGYHAQAEAIRHGIARVLVKFNSNFRKRLRKAGYLTRDPRMRERKKFGLKRARRAPQWSKR